jgi:hypothetical protein
MSELTLTPLQTDFNSRKRTVKMGSGKIVLFKK